MTQAILRARHTGGNALDQPNGRRPARRPFLASLAVIAALAPAVSSAATIPISVDAMFAANGVSIWTGRPGPSYDTGDRFLGVDWNFNQLHLGHVAKECVTLPIIGTNCVSFGAEIGAETYGRAGIPYRLKVESGTMDIHYPGRAVFNVPASFSGEGPNPAVTIQTQFTGLPLGTFLPNSPNGTQALRAPTLQVRSPDVQAYVELAAELKAFAGAQVCIFICHTSTPSIDVYGNESQELFALNRDGDGEIRLLGETVVSSNLSYSLAGGLLNASFKLPHLDSSSLNTPGGFDGRNLVSSQRDSIATLQANLAQVVLTALALPIPLTGQFGPFGYNLLEVGAGASISLRETLTFTPMATARLLFTSDVVPEIGGVSRAPTNFIDFTLGEDVTFTPQLVGEIGVAPIITLGGRVNHSIDLVLAGHVDVRALGLNVNAPGFFDVSVGPLVNESLGSNELGSFRLYNEGFDLDLGNVAARPFNLGFGECILDNIPGEIGQDLYHCEASGYTGSSSSGQANGTSMDQLFKEICPEHSIGTAQSCFHTFGGSTSQYFSGASGDVFLGSADALSFDQVMPGPGTTDASEAQLLATLLKGGAETGAFIIPAGFPQEAFVPEPATGTLLGLAFFGLLAVRASRSKRPRREGPRITA